METHELLKVVAKVLASLGVRYFVTGSIATIFYGEPRFTNDIDIVADLRPAHVAGFCAAFEGDEFYLSPDSVRRAIRQRSQFNLIHPKSGLKVDLLIPTPSEFNESRFRRASQVQPARNLEVFFSAPEDVILKKMEYYQEGGSDKHLRDITGILRVAGDSIDNSYLDQWSQRLGVSNLLEALRDRLSSSVKEE